MDMTRESAEQSLREIEEIEKKTRLDRDWRGGDLLLILWGAVWIFAFLGSHYYPGKADLFWMVGNSVGIAGTILVVRNISQNVKSEDTSKIGIFWFVLFAFTPVQIAIMSPTDGIQVNAFICLQIMFAYAVMGLWLRLNGMLVLSAVISVLTLVGYFLMSPYYNLWMACTSGVVLFGSGLYARYLMSRK